jgi:hypothetical protein
MEKEFVNYEIALALKELYFNEPCFAKYFQQDGNTPFIQIGESEIDEAENAGDDVTFECDAPLYQQAFRWFRENYGIVGYCYIPNESGYWGHSFENKAKYDTYEEAELECLKKLIEICKQNLK